MCPADGFTPSSEAKSGGIPKSITKGRNLHGELRIVWHRDFRTILLRVRSAARFGLGNDGARRR